MSQRNIRGTSARDQIDDGMLELEDTPQTTQYDGRYGTAYGKSTAKEAERQNYDHLETYEQCVARLVSEGRQMLEKADRWDGAIGFAKLSGFEDTEKAANNALQSTVEHMLGHGLPLNVKSLAEGMEHWLDSHAPAPNKKPAELSI